jgi:hypothetical protein
MEAVHIGNGTVCLLNLLGLAQSNCAQSVVGIKEMLLLTIWSIERHPSMAICEAVSCWLNEKYT